MDIRYAGDDDVAALLELRNHYIRHSYATFDEQELTRQDVVEWMSRFRRDGPHRLLVAERDGRLLGFCSSQPYRPHPAFARTIETSVYVDPGAGRGGVASALYDALFRALAGQGLHRVVVGIALPNDASIALHAKFGFSKVGVFDEYAHKNGRFLSSQWMERSL